MAGYFAADGSWVSTKKLVPLSCFCGFVVISVQCWIDDEIVIGCLIV